MVAPLNRNQEASKKDLKKEKSLAIKMIFDEIFYEDKDMTCLTRRYQKLETKHRGLQKAENSNIVVNSNHLCHKCGKPGHFIRDCPMHKVEVKTYQRPGGEKDRNRDPVSDKKVRKVAVGYIMKKAFDVCGDSSSESDELECHVDVPMLAVKGDKDVFDDTFALMEKSDDEEDEEEVTLSDLIQNLHVYCVKKLRILVVVLIDSIIESTIETKLMNNSLDILHEEKVALVDQMPVVEENVIVLEAENLELKQRLKMLSKKSGKGKEKASRMQMKLETSLDTAETKLTMALERNNQLERNLDRVKEELNKSHK